jgi:hypothetical protein
VDGEGTGDEEGMERVERGTGGEGRGIGMEEGRGRDEGGLDEVKTYEYGIGTITDRRRLTFLKFTLARKNNNKKDGK